MPAYHWAELSSRNKAGRISVLFFFLQKIDDVCEVQCEYRKEKSVGERGVAWKEELTLIQKNLWNGMELWAIFRKLRRIANRFKSRKSIFFLAKDEKYGVGW